MKPQTADILISNGFVLTMNGNGDVIQNGTVVIKGDMIAAVGNTNEFSAWKASQTIDAAGGIIMPGLVNTHTHAAMTSFRGIADDLPLMTWLDEHIFPAESRLNDKKVYSGTLLACAEMIMSGTTCFCDMYLFEDAVAEAAKDAGMRAVVGEVLYDFDSPNYGPIDQGFEYTQQLIDKWKDDPLIIPAVEPHSPYLCAPELLQKAFSISQSHDVPMVIHLSEAQSEVQGIKQKYNRTPVKHLAELGVLGANVVACHCVVLSKEDINLLRRFNVKVSHCPESNMKLASGIAPIPQLLDQEICVGLGTDGCASNNNLDLFLEMDTAAKLHKVNTLDPTVLNAPTALRMATLQGAKALGIEKIVGSLEPGKKADVIVIDTRKPHLTPMYNPISHVVYAARGSDVSTSIINGRIMMENGKLLSLDLEKAMADVNQIADEIRDISV
jgi:5-methylthioadenosine/S-adenosylhomocysteine deaminase